MMNKVVDLNVREYLKTSTQSVHEALHHDPLFSRLLKSDLQTHEYQSCLRVSLTFFDSIEKVRASEDLHHTFSLARFIDALRADLGQAGLSQELNTAIKTEFVREQLLGALYVAHGSQFGRQVIGQAVAQSLPNASRQYFDMKSGQENWRLLLSRLENEATAPHKLAAIETGANSAFSLFSDLAEKAFQQLPNSQRIQN